MKSVFCCPVYDEVREFPGTLKELRASHACDTVLLVNNGSTDGSEHLVRASGLPHIEVERNLGLGHALMLGLDWALERGYDVFGVIAANGKMLPAEMPRLLDPILAGEFDCVTGSRFLQDGDAPNLPSFRRRAIPLVNLLARVLTGRRLTDATCGYRALRVEPLTRATFDWHAPWLRRYGFEFYVYAKYLLDDRLRCTEVPVTMRYPPRGRAYTKVPLVTGWASMIRPWLVARLDGRGFLRAPSGEP